MAGGRKCQVVTRSRNTIGLPGRLVCGCNPTTHRVHGRRGVDPGRLCTARRRRDRIKPGDRQHPGHDQPAEADRRRPAALRTSRAVLRAHPHHQHARGHRARAPVDLAFQSIAGTEAANRSSASTSPWLAEAHDAPLLRRGTVGENVMYFRDRPGQPLSAGAHHGRRPTDHRDPGATRSREFDPLLVTRGGVHRPEYLYDGKQIIRAGLEDHFCGKLLGVRWLRRLLHQPRRGRPGRHGQPA